MTRHTHITSRYVPQTGDDAAIQLNAFLNRLTEQLSAASGHLTAEALRHMIMEARKWPPPNDPKMEGQGRGIPCGGMTVNYVGSGAGHTVEPNTVYDSSADYWSPWLEWRGGPCPLPPVVIEIEGEPPYVSQASNWERPFRFRYVAKDPAGWLPRGKFIPPAELWDEGCPVRLHIRTDNGGEGWAQHYPRDWDGITHIRLVARQPQEGLPEWVEFAGADAGWRIGLEGPPGRNAWLETSWCESPDDLDRIAEACTKLAARERARRAGA